MMAAMRAREIAVPRLQAEEMADLVAYLYSVRYFAEPGDPARGRQVLGDKGCLGCHSVSGAGGKVASDFARVKGLDSPGTVISALWNHSFIRDPRPEREGAPDRGRRQVRQPRRLVGPRVDRSCLGVVDPQPPARQLPRDERFDRRQHVHHVEGRQAWRSMEGLHPIGPGGKYAVEHERVEMDVQIQRATEPRGPRPRRCGRAPR